MDDNTLVSHVIEMKDSQGKIATDVEVIKNTLLSENGLVKTVALHGTEITQQGKQISYWKGAIALLAFLLVILATALAAHISGGK